MDILSFLAPGIYRKLDLILIKLEAIMATQAETVVQINALTTQVAKVRAEVQNLIDVIATGGNTTPELDAAVASLQSAMQGLDDLNPDAPTP